MDTTLQVQKKNLVSVKGYNFQMTLLISFLLRSLKMSERGNQLHFRSEVIGVGAWDDIHVEENNNGKKTWTLFQAKHHDNTASQKISDQALTSLKGDYSLPKYFLSFVEAKNTAALHSAQIESVVICTTSGFPEKGNRMMKIQEIPFSRNQLWRELLSVPNEIDNNLFYSIADPEELWLKLNVEEVRNDLMKGSLLQNEEAEQLQLLLFKKDVTEFCEKLIFCVKIPKLDSFVELLKHELNEIIPLKNIEQFYPSLFENFCAWAVKTFPSPLTVMSYQEMLIEVVTYHQLTDLSPYSKTISKDPQIIFRDMPEMTEFLIQSNNKIKIICTDSELSNHRVYHAMEKIHFQFVIIPLQNIITNFEEISKYMQGQICNLHFIIDSISRSEEDVADFLSRVSENCIKHQPCVLLLHTSHKENSVTQKFQSRLEIFHSDVKADFSDLVAESKDFILQKFVNFQGKKARLGDILTPAEVCYDVLNEQLLKQLLQHGDELEVGVHLPDIKRTKFYYIQRKLLSKLKATIGDVNKWDKKQQIDFTECSESFVILAADPGMGKSTFLQHTAHEMKQLHPQYLVIYMNLADHTRLLYNLKKEPNPDDINQFLHLALETANNPIMTSVLIPWMRQCPDRTAIFIDSFDEINPNYSEKVIRIIAHLASLNPFRLCVATRFHTQKLLEDSLNTNAYTLKEFTQEDQTAFLKEFWKHNLRLNEDKLSKTRFIPFTKNLFQFISRSIYDSQVEFMGIPLQTRMVAEAFQDRFNRWITETSHNDATSTFPDNYNIFCLYKEFLQKKFEILFTEKLRKDLTVPEISEEIKSTYSKFEKAAAELALGMLFSPDDLESLSIYSKFCDITINKRQDSNKEVTKFPNVNPHQINNLNHTPEMDDWELATYQQSKEDKSKKLKEKISKLFTGLDGVVVVSSDDECRFVHRTFSEYFAGCYLGKLFRKEINQSLPEKIHAILTKIREDASYRVVRLFMDYSICADLPLHCAVLDNDIVDIQKLMHQHSNDTDGLKRSALQLAIYWNRFYAMNLLLRSPQPVKDFDLLNVSPITHTFVKLKKNIYFNEGFQHVLFYLLIKNRLKRDAFPSARTDTDRENMVSQNSLINEAKYLILFMRDLIILTKEQLWDLEESIRAMCNGDCLAELVLNTQPITPPLKALVWGITRNKEDDIDVVVFNAVVCGDLLLHGAVMCNYYSDIDMCRRLLLQGENVNAVDVLGRTPMHLAAASGNAGIVDMLCEFGANLDVIDVFGDTAVVVAACRGKLGCVELLSLRGASLQPLLKLNSIDWDTLLYDAAEGGFENVVKLCLVKSANPNKQSKWGLTPLHEASCNGRIVIVKLLLDVGAQNDIKESKGRTPEQYMMDSNYLSDDMKQRITDLFHQPSSNRIIMK